MYKKVLFATNMVESGKRERLTFTAPSEPGEYPYVCTFPRHWMRMYGVMVVVEDLDAWLQDPKKPKDPTGNNRSFVKAWTVDDFSGDLAKSAAIVSVEVIDPKVIGDVEIRVAVEVVVCEGRRQ